MVEPKEEIAVLFQAAALGRADIVKNALSSLSAQEISTSRPDDQLTPLHIAALGSHADVIRSLLVAGSSFESRPKLGIYEGKSPYDCATEASKNIFHIYLFEQIAMGNIETIGKLIDGGIPVDIKDGFKSNDSTLHWASSFGSIEVVKLLLSRGCEVNIVNDDGHNSLHIACKNANSDLVKLLLLEGGDISAMDKEGRRPADLLINANESIEKLLASPPLPTFAFSKPVAAAGSSTSSASDVGKVRDSDSFVPQDVRRRNNSLVARGLADDSADARAFSVKPTTAETPTAPPLLVLWPPAQRQRRTGKAPLLLSSQMTLLISVASTDIDVIPLLTLSGLLDVFEKFNIRSQLKRSTPRAKLRLCIDRYSCPGHQRFELNVTPALATLTASDQTGLLYAIQAFIQLLQLHSEVKSAHGVTSIMIPPITISDWPDVLNRAVLWSYRHTARMSTQAMRECIELLARVRMNQLLLVVDCVDGSQAQNAEEEDSAEAGMQSEMPAHDAPATKVYALDELCRRSCVELVPSAVITSINQRLPIDLLKNFSHPVINVFFTFDQVAIKAEFLADDKFLLKQLQASEQYRVYLAEAVSKSTLSPDEDISLVMQWACMYAAERVISSVALAGFSTVFLACDTWSRAAVAPLNVAGRRGLGVIEKKNEELEPSSLFLKPLVSIDEYTKLLNSYAKSRFDDCLTTSVFPSFMETDTFYPPLMSKYCCFLHAGFAWNRLSAIDMLMGNSLQQLTSSIPNDFLGVYDSSTILDSAVATAPDRLTIDGSILREVASLTIFRKRAEHVSNAQAYMLSLFTGEFLASEAMSITDAKKSGVEDIIINSGTVSLSEIAGVERFLWSLLFSDSPASLSISLVPPKAAIAAATKHYRRLLTTLNWKIATAREITSPRKPQKNTFSIFYSSSASSLDDIAAPGAARHSPTLLESDIDEVLSLTHMLSILCRALSLGYAGLPKDSPDHEPITFEALASHISLGSKSDVINQMLESFEYSSLSLSRRFDALDFQSESHSQPQEQLYATTPQVVTAAYRRRYLRAARPTVPGAAFFHVLSRQLPTSMLDTALGTLSRLFPPALVKQV